MTKAGRHAAQLERAAILAGPLRPWMKRLAEWHATQEGRVLLEQCRDVAIQFAGVSISLAATKALVTRDDWMAYREEIALDQLLQVRKRLQHRTAQYVDAHLKALEMAEANEDYRAMAQIAEPMVDRVWAKREQHVQQNQTVILNLAPGSTPAQVLATEFKPIEVEVLPQTDDPP